MSENKYDVLKDKGISVLFSVPTKDKTVTLGFCVSLVQTAETFFKLGIPFILVDANNSNFTDLTRNMAVQVFMKSKGTHILQIDSDMKWEPNVILDMLLYDKEFIAGVGRKKVEDEEYAGVNFTADDGTPMGQMGEKEEDVLIQMKYVGGAFTLLKRSVFEKLILNYPILKCEQVGYAFYQTRYEPNCYKTEDYLFCELCNDIGIDIWCYPNINMGHQGIKDYKGNYFDYLKALPAARVPAKTVLNEGFQKITEEILHEA